MIHQTAVVHSEAKVDPSVTIGPYAVIESGVTLEKGYRGRPQDRLRAPVEHVFVVPHSLERRCLGE